MSIVFSVSELINTAIGIEIRGITFYDVMAKSTDNEMARSVFQNLAQMEREHIQIFQDMLGEGKKHPPEAMNEEYADYLRALVDNAVFTDDMITSEMATQADSDIKAVELGIAAEKDSILFYSQMREVIPRSALPMLDRVIAEEKWHLRQLAEIKKRLAAGNSGGQPPYQ
jgi:rubrerythrin